MTADLLYSNVFQLCKQRPKSITDEDILNTYKIDPDKGISYALVKYDGIVYHIANKYYTLENEDKRSLVLEGVFKTISTYDASKQANFATHLTHVLINLFSNEVRKNNTKARSLPDGATLDYLDSEEENGAGETYSRVGDNDYRLTDIEFIDCIKVLSLEDIEYKYLELILGDSLVPKDSEICRHLGIARHLLPTLKKHLGKKIYKAINA